MILAAADKYRNSRLFSLAQTIHEETTRRNYSTFVRSTLAALTGAGSVPPSGLQPGKRGPFNETTLPDIAVLRTSAAA